ncbi:MAG: DUF1906 domain-containing protein [Oscillospiraceae bacterium]|nr:DUF1906 domain-containing protein [Oscillospiraceae bacterium]
MNIKKKIQMILAMVTAMITTVSFLPPQAMKLMCVQVIDTCYALTSDEELGEFRDYVDLMEQLGRQGDTGHDGYVWSAQHWFNYKYCITAAPEQLTDIPNLIHFINLRTASNQYYRSYDLGAYNFPSYDLSVVDGQSRYDTMWSLRCALQVELINYSDSVSQDEKSSGAYLSLYDMFDDGSNYFGSFGPATSKALDTMISNCGGLSGLAKSHPDVIRILQYGLACKGYDSLDYGGGNLSYATGELSDKGEVKGLGEMLDDAGIGSRVSINSVIFKAALNTDSYSANYEKSDKKVRELQLLLNKELFDKTYSGQTMGIGPCDGIYGRETSDRALYFYQSLVLPDGIEPNGNFGPSTYGYTPEISIGYGSQETEQKLLKLIEYQLYVYGCKKISIDQSYNNFTAQAADSFKKFMKLPNDSDGIIHKETIKSLFMSCGDTNRSSFGCDTSRQLSKSDIQFLKESGYQYIGRYVVDERFEVKRLLETEAKNIIDAGMKIIPIYEGFNCIDIDGFKDEKYIEKARTDAVDSIKAAMNIGIPKGSVLYFAIDFDPTDDQIKESIINYFGELKKQMSCYGFLYKVGVYGSRNVCSQVYDAGYAESCYVADASTGWSGNMGFVMPTKWAFDQFYVPSTEEENAAKENGTFLVDKVAVSGLDYGVSYLNNSVKTEFEVSEKLAPMMEQLVFGNIYGDPVDLSSGSHTIDYTALSLSGAQNIDFTVSYSSSDNSDSEVGRGWHHNYEKRIEKKVIKRSDIIPYELNDENVSDAANEMADINIVNLYETPSCCIEYIQQDSDTYIPDSNTCQGYILKENKDGTWELNCNNKEWYYFNKNGKLTEHKNKEGMTVSVQDSDSELIITEDYSGKQIKALKENGKITKVYSDDKQGTVSFEYHDNNLTNITDFNGSSVTYTYDSSGRVLTGTDSDDVRYFTDTYYDDEYFAGLSDELGLNTVMSDEDRHNANVIYNIAVKTKYGRIKSQTDALGNVSEFDYKFDYPESDNGQPDKYQFVVTVTDRNKKETTSTFDYNRQLVVYKDQNGDETKYIYDNDSLDLIKIIDAAGYTETMTYDSLHNLLSKQDKNNLITEYAYDNSGNITDKIFIDKNNQEYSHEKYVYSNNLITEKTDERGNVTKYIYTDGLLTQKIIISPDNEERNYSYSYKNGLLTKSSDPYDNTVITKHNQSGLVESVTDSLDHITREITYDNNGNIDSEVMHTSEDESYEISHSYNCRGMELSESDSKGTIFKNTYNGNGKLVSSTDGNKNETKYEYDAEDRLISVTDAEGGSKQIEYDDGGRVIRETDELSNVTEYQYDSKENTKVTTFKKRNDDSGEYEIIRQTKAKYDGYGNILWQKDSYDTLTEYEYNEKNQLVEIIYAKGKDEQTQETYSYNDYGDLISITDGEGNTQKFEYDSFGNKTAYTDANLNRTEYTYDKCSNLKTQANALMLKENKSIEYDYDANGRMISQTSCNGNTTRFNYDYQGRLISVTDPLGRTSTSEYDIRNNILSLVNNENVIVTENKYDNADNLISTTDALKSSTTFNYDKSGRLISITDPMENQTLYDYDKTGNLVKSTDALNNNSYASYDESGRIISLSDSNSSQPLYQYDKSGNIIYKQTTSNKNVTYGYNSLNLCTQMINARNQNTTYTYDKAGRVTGYVQYNEDSTEKDAGTYTYDSCGNVLTAENSTGKITRTYDELNRVKTYTDTFGKMITYTYDLENNLSRIDYPDEGAEKIFVEYKYNEANQLTDVTDWKGNNTEYKYNSLGELKNIKRPDGSEQYNFYDNAGNVQQITDLNADGDRLNAYSYTYDKNSDLKTVESFNDNKTYNYNYDKLGRITDLTESDSQYLFNTKLKLFRTMTETGYLMPGDMIIRLCRYDQGTTTKEYFGYDSKGNITAENKVINVDGQTASTAVSKTFRYGINNQLTNYTDNNQTAANNSAYSMSLGILPFYFPNFIKYDDDGNIISMPLNGETAVLEYDAFNNLTSCADMKYTYDIESNRIKTQDKNKTTTYLYDTTSAVPRILESTTDGKTTIYVYGRELISEATSENSRYYHYDYQGNTALLTDETGKTTDRYRYDVYGKTEHYQGESETPFKYNGKYSVITDSNDLIYMGSRYYSTDLMRFISADVLTGNVSDTQSLNRYTYCKGNPVKYTDPSGMSPEVKAQKQAELEKEKREKVHNVFDAAGMLPFIGGIFDATNGLIYWAEGDGEGVGLTAMAFLPVAGIISTPAKHADDIAEVSVKYGSELAENVLRESDEIGGVVEGVSNRKVFTSNDPLVGDLATNIEANLSGRVVGVNKIIIGDDGLIKTDLDIELDNAVLQVKKGGGKGMVSQLERTAKITNKTVIGYGPDIKGSIVKGANAKGFNVFRSESELIEYLKNLK